MKDEDILKNPPSDWKPEADIKLQKAFGKLVEELGELLEAVVDYLDPSVADGAEKLENEIADTLAFSKIVGDLCSVPVTWFHPPVFDKCLTCDKHSLSLVVSRTNGKLLNVIGRCQIQGIEGVDPTSGQTNRERLQNAITTFTLSTDLLVHEFCLNKDRIASRINLKIKAKLPWILGTLKQEETSA